VKNAIIALGYLGGMTIVLVIGLTLLISPRHFFRLQDRLGKTRFWSRPSPTWDAGAGLQWRALGLFLTLLSLFMVLGPFLRDRAQHDVEKQSMVAVQDGLLTLHAGSLLFLSIFLALGLSFAIKPNSTVGWVIPRDALAGGTQAQRARVLRRFGAILVFVALLGFYLTLYR
jgi:hypothetical protein